MAANGDDVAGSAREYDQPAIGPEEEKQQEIELATKAQRVAPAELECRERQREVPAREHTFNAGRHSAAHQAVQPVVVRARRAELPLIE